MKQQLQFIRFILSLAVAVAIIAGCENSNRGNSLAVDPPKNDHASLAQTPQQYQSWRVYGGDSANTHFSSLTQINRSNVSSLSVAWDYHSARGQSIPTASELQVNPIIIGNTLYGRNPNYNVFAIEADSGKELWRFEPDAAHVGLSFMRGLSYWENSNSTNADRIFFTTAHKLIALDASNGEVIEKFGNQGIVDLRKGLGRDPNKIAVYAPSPGVIFENLIIIGSAVNETQGAAPGDIRAYDVVSGELIWSFHTLPHQGEYGYDTWPADHWKTGGGANAWAGLSVDPVRAVVYAPTGSPTPDFNGSDRPGSNLFSNSVLALNARTGERIWHYQTVHHDLWDRDLSSPPTLAQIKQHGKTKDVVVQASKQGVLYVLDRDTGKPIFPIEEVSVPASDIPGEYTHPTQPQVTLPEPFTRQSFDANEITNISSDAYEYVKKQFDQAAPFEYFRPPGLKPTIVFPGFYGGSNWGGGAFDTETGIYYINAMEDANIVNIEAIEVDKGSEFGFGEFVFKKHCSGCHGDQLQGFYPYAPALKDVHINSNKKDALRIINNGKGRMMPFSHLPRHEQVAALDYLFEFSASQANKSDNNPSPNRPKTNSQTTETAYVFGGYTPFMDQRYYPAIKPPWGTLNAIDLASGKRLWQVPLGEYTELTQEGVPPTGTRNYGGPIVTAGGLLIIAASSDEKLRIFDKNNGNLLWEYSLPAAGYATPSTYQVNGKQYIVITCSGGKLGTQSGDRYLAFSLD